MISDIQGVPVGGSAVRVMKTSGMNVEVRESVLCYCSAYIICKSWKKIFYKSYGFTLIIPIKGINVSVPIFFSDTMFHLVPKLSIYSSNTQRDVFEYPKPKIIFLYSSDLMKRVSYFFSLHLFNHHCKV